MGEARSVRDERGHPGEGICEVCREREIIGVYAMPGVPISHGYCKECSQANAHPYGSVVANTACIGGFDRAAEWWQETVKDTLKHLGINMEEFQEDVEESLRKEKEYFEEMAKKELNEFYKLLVERFGECRVGDYKTFMITKNHLVGDVTLSEAQDLGESKSWTVEDVYDGNGLEKMLEGALELDWVKAALDG